MPMSRRALRVMAASLILGVSTVWAAKPNPGEGSGNVSHGKAVFIAHRCYACHGYSGQTGLRRIVPMGWPQETFVQFVRHSTLAAMPSYPDVSTADLEDLYAYLRSIPLDAPAVKDTPLLRAVQKQSDQVAKDAAARQEK